MTEIPNKNNLSVLTDEEIAGILRYNSKIEQKIKNMVFDELMRRYSRKVLGIILQRVRNEQDAMDISQESFSQIYESIPGFRGDSKLFSWMYRIIDNKINDYIKKKKREGIVFKPQPPQDNPDIPEKTPEDYGSDSTSPEGRIISNETKKLVRAALEELPEDQRDAISKFFLEELSYREISDILSVPEGTLRSRVYYAKLSLAKNEILRKELAPYFSA